MTRRRTFFATLGFSESLVLATIPVFGSENHNRLIIITSKDSSKQTTKTIKAIDRLVESFRFTGKTIDFKQKFVEETEFQKNLSSLCNMIRTEATNN
ncbi:MAG: hypothetical protein JSW11_13480 [Candidatus Heimdallarchaeota archaeon]|nr:MAG: hypothetical protein JSW11_13480 [Candidatus Heimdallarchaeota archaeon]